LISILRSNQPIAWSIVPTTIFAGILWHIWASQASAVSLVIYGIGLLSVAAYSHHLYVQRNFVERGDAALAWSVVAWSIALIPVASPAEGIQTWLSLLLICASLDQTLRMHRQPSTSNIQFRAGLAAGLAVGIQPLNLGILLGLMLVQIRTRPFLFREWILLVFGLVHGWLVAEFVWSIELVSSAFETPSTATPSDIATSRYAWSAIAIGISAVLGLFMLMRENPRLILKTRNTRYNAIIVLAALVATCTVLCWLEPWESSRIRFLSQAISHWSVLTALTLGFLSVSLVPKRDRRGDKLNALDATGWIVFVGTLLVVFGLRSFQ
jgi:hypothetical protein